MKKLSLLLLIFGSGLIIAAFTILTLTYYPVITAELGYLLQGLSQNTEVSASASAAQSKDNLIYPVDTQFGIVIPKIRANAKVLPDINPYDSQEYQVALTQGVAHAKGTVFPGQKGNVFIFAHSSVSFYEAARYNSLFYLLYRLEKGDTIDLFYHGEKFVYKVNGKKITDPTDTSYLKSRGEQSTLTLMTCWPPGTTLKRLMVLSDLVK